jgi:ubiquinone/menaquinone biosynthesis C-methylase UbiE
MQKISYSSLKNEAEAYWKWVQETPAPAIPAPVAREGAGSELRTPIMHYGVVMPVYMSVARYLKALKPKKGMRLIELGSGSGRPLTYLKTLFPELEVWGVDYSADGIAYAKKSYGKQGVKFKHVRAQDTSLKKEHFDFVISSHVIEHVTKDEGLDFLQEAYRLLKPGGYLFVGTPERRMCQELYMKNPTDKLKGRLVPPHEHEYTLPELKKLAQQVFPAKSVTVDMLVNPKFHTIFKEIIHKFKPKGTFTSKATSTSYRTIRDMIPRPIFDTVGRIGAKQQMKKHGYTFQDILMANSIQKEGRKAPDNLFLVCRK